MKQITTLIPLLFSLALIGCQKQPEEVTTAATGKTNLVAKAEFEKSDAIINTYLDKLDNAETPQAERTQILCKDYPTEYKTNYMPALLKLSPTEYTRAQLLKDLDIALDYYKKKDNIECQS
ncbi:hypothetical protein GCM10023345_15040 [Acinetobacter kookii]|uniref:Uncharacterized protein n=1 Tax=Acinetobacter kookii TaxID=1226327 RepID=A0A1G6GNA3_9GAMM|nr:hypothetical protein [Acinetobacter kookii]SDB83424.1 hypothetical protein SAMN05421732_101137 [Acinetobacter kookii]